MVWLLALGLPLIAGACKGNALNVVDPERATPAKPSRYPGTSRACAARIANESLGVTKK